MIAIIAAMQAEVDMILVHMSEYEEKYIHKLKVYEGRIHSKMCVVALAGVGKVNAARATTTLCTSFDVEYVFNVGVAGGLRQNQNPLDIIIGKDVIQYDFDTSFIDGEAGIGIHAHTSDRLNKLCENACKVYGLVAHEGDIATGDLFVTSKDVHKILNHFPNAACAEMEAGAIAYIANQFEVECLIIRSLSDVAVKEGNHLDFKTFTIEASRNAGNIMEYVISHM